MASIRNLHIQQRQNRRSTQELNQITPSAPQTTRTQVNQEDANLITFSPVAEQQVPLVQGAIGIQNPTQMTEKSTKEEEFRMDTQSRTIQSQQNPGNFPYFTWRTVECVQWRRERVVLTTAGQKETRKLFLYQMW